MIEYFCFVCGSALSLHSDVCPGCGILIDRQNRGVCFDF